MPDGFDDDEGGGERPPRSNGHANGANGHGTPLQPGPELDDEDDLDQDPDPDDDLDPDEDSEDELPGRPPPPPGWGRSWAGASLAWLILAIYGVTGPEEPGAKAFERGAADASLVAQEPWRAVTALTLHADLAHVLSNAAALFVFVTPIAWRIGPGATVATLLAASIAANLLASWLYGQGVVSVGASTAAFAALGMLGAGTVVDPSRRRQSWMVIAASIALLGFLGTGPHSDVMAHLTGWGCGLVLGVPAALAFRKPPRGSVQAVLAAGAALVVAGAWAMALARDF